MTDNQQLRAAAERVYPIEYGCSEKRRYGGMKITDWTVDVWDVLAQMHADIKLLQDAYLAAHRDDDWEAVTDEWFESVGATWMDSDVQKNALMLRLGPLEMVREPPIARG